MKLRRKKYMISNVNAQLDQRVIDNAVKQWHRRLRSCVAGCERRSFRTVTVEHPAQSVAVWAKSDFVASTIFGMSMTNSFCVNAASKPNDFGSFSAIFIGIFLVISAWSFDVLETLRSDIDIENQQRIFHMKTWQLRMHCNLRPPEPRQPFPALITTPCQVWSRLTYTCLLYTSPSPRD